MRMRIAGIVTEQIGGREISLATIFRHRFIYKTFLQH